MNHIKITLIANAGVLIEYSHYKFLIDGIHSNNPYGFGAVKEETLHLIINGEPPFDRITGILFTHCHEDHFCEWNTLKTLQNNMPSLYKFIMPLRQCYRFPELYKYLCDWREKIVLLALTEYKTKKIEFGMDASVTCFCIVHAGEAYRTVENYCYLFTLGEKKILILGDAGFDTIGFYKLLNDISLDAVVINPLYLNAAMGRSIILDIMQPKALIVYHIPHGKNCNSFLRNVAKKDSKKYWTLFNNSLPSFDKIYCLSNPGEKILL